jgi:hypothetical protein
MLAPLSFAIALAALTISSAAGAQTAQTPPAAGAAAPATVSCMETMMKMHGRMMTEMIANDAKLEALVAEMSSAKGDAQIAALRATLNELVRQYRAERLHMREMHEHMTQAHAPAADAGAAPHVH